MAISLNSVISFNPKLQPNYNQVPRSNIRALLVKVPPITSLAGAAGLRQYAEEKRSRLYLLATPGDNVITDNTNTESKTTEGTSSDNGPSNNVSNVNSSAPDKKIPATEGGSTPQVFEVSNGSPNPTNSNQEGSASKSNPTVKRAPLTARERLRAARVLNRYTESKPSSPQLGSKLLEALRETDKGKKRPSLPEAPTNLLDDSKRGLSPGGWSISLPPGMDVYLIAFSFVFISSVMFATTFIVWKVGAIHFNEY